MLTRFVRLALLSVCALTREVHAIQTVGTDGLPLPTTNSCRRHRHFRRNVANFMVAAEGLALSSKLSAIQIGGKQLERHEFATNVMLGLNTAVLLAWCVTRLCGRGVEFMISNFLLSEEKQTRRTKPHTVITAAFSHIGLSHFLSNMGALHVFMPDVVCALGCRGFAYFYVASGYASTFLGDLLFSRTSASSLFMARAVAFTKKYVKHVCGEKRYEGEDHEELVDELIAQVLEEEEARSKHQMSIAKDQPRYSLGASGVISAVMSFHCLTFPHKTFPIGERNLEAPLAVVVWAVNDILLLHHDAHVGHGCHLGGALFGVVVYAVLTALNPCRRAKVFAWLSEFVRSSQMRNRVWTMIKNGVVTVVHSVD